MVAWQVPESEEFPEGLKYSFHYMDADSTTLLRYDNAPHHLAIGRHHRHTATGEITPVTFTTLSDLITTFQTEVNHIYERQD